MNAVLKVAGKNLVQKLPYPYMLEGITTLIEKYLLAKGVISLLLILIIKKGTGKNVLRLNP